MKPHPRIRKTVKWGGAAMTVLLLALWTWSGWYAINWVLRDGTWASLRAGRFHYQYEAASGLQPRIYTYGHGGPNFDWRPYSDVTGRLGLPLWLLAAPIWTITILGWRLDTLARRRARMNLCHKCHYDRTGLAAGAVCPECGTGSGTA